MLTYIPRTEANHRRIAIPGRAESFYQSQCTWKCPWSIRSRNWNILLYYKRFLIDQTMAKKNKYWRNLRGQRVSMIESFTMLQTISREPFCPPALNLIKLSARLCAPQGLSLRAISSTNPAFSEPSPTHGRRGPDEACLLKARTH